MNDKIKNLFNICGMPNEDIMELFEDKNKTFYMEKFAELIIRECIKSVEKMYCKPLDCQDEWWEGYAARGADSIEIIKDHFGVDNE
jgi:hypothetical protein